MEKENSKKKEERKSGGERTKPKRNCYNKNCWKNYGFLYDDSKVLHTIIYFQWICDVWPYAVFERKKHENNLESQGGGGKGSEFEYIKNFIDCL